MFEGQQIEKKSLRKVRGAHPDWSGLAAECVGFANAQGGLLVISIENGATEPPAGQQIDEAELSFVMRKLKGQSESVGFGENEIVSYESGGQAMHIKVHPSRNIIATTSSGRVYLRTNEECLPISGHDLTVLAEEKSAFQWELAQVGKWTLADVDTVKASVFLDAVRDSANTNVSQFIKDKEDAEIFRHFQFLEGEFLTNLGILWLGTPEMRARLRYPLTAQYLVYDERENKVRKETWHSHDLNPKELILAIEAQATELRYSYELPQGMFRERIPHYAPEVVRELLVNAFAHQRLTLSADVFVAVYPDRAEVSSPGGLPLGVSTASILHQRSRRNPHLMAVMEALGLMEGEGSGYDMIYEKLSADGKPFPEIESTFERTKVTVGSRILDEEIIRLIGFATRNFDLRQKDIIVLGVIAREHKIRSTQLSKTLGLDAGERLASWTQRLVDLHLVKQSGVKKATSFTLNPTLVRDAQLNIPSSLKTMEPHRLDALVEEDLKLHAWSGMAEIHDRLPDVDRSDLEKSVMRLRKANRVIHQGEKRWTKYALCSLHKTDRS